MALDSVPWFVGGGAEHSPDVARLLAHAATGGASGVIGSTDLRCTTTPAPTGNVRVMPGACIIPNTYAGVASQSYMARAASVTDLPITPTGSSGGRSDMVIVRVDDPQFGGSAPADIATGPYVKFEVLTNVGSGATAVPGTVAYPAIALCRIDLPANTATVTADLIKDLRKLPQPRRQRDLYVRTPVSAQDLTATSFVNFPSEANVSIEVPKWATQAKIICHYAGLQNVGGSSYQYLQAKLGTLLAQSVVSDIDQSWSSQRYSTLVADTLDIPASMRGTTQTLKSEGRTNSGYPGHFQSDSATTVMWDVEFLEAPSAD